MDDQGYSVQHSFLPPVERPSYEVPDTRPYDQEGPKNDEWTPVEEAKLQEALNLYDFRLTPGLTVIGRRLRTLSEAGQKMRLFVHLTV